MVNEVPSSWTLAEAWWANSVSHDSIDYFEVPRGVNESDGNLKSVDTKTEIYFENLLETNGDKSEGDSIVEEYGTVVECERFIVCV